MPWEKPVQFQGLSYLQWPNGNYIRFLRMNHTQYEDATQSMKTDDSKIYAIVTLAEVHTLLRTFFFFYYYYYYYNYYTKKGSTQS